MSRNPNDRPAPAPASADDNSAGGRDFIREIIAEDLASGKHESIQTRFPPEPNGYLHIGHAKAICLNFGIARETGGRCNLRFDDTNPTTEEVEYVESIEDDVRWLGFEWDGLFFASDYFEQLYQWARHLIREGNAYVDSSTTDEIRDHRGRWDEPGTESPYRDRPIAESLDLFERMRAGEFGDGAHVLRARIDMTSGNMNLRDPILYRIRHAHHHRTADDWCIYPSYDYAHGQSDAIEGVTHSLCTLEFEDHRPLYDWFLDHLPVPQRPRQIEFARLNPSYTIVSKRKLLQLVKQDLVSGWDDPRMPTLKGLRRRGYTPEAIRDFCDRVGITKNDSTTDYALLEYSIREHLNRIALRRMAVLRPLELVIESYPDDLVEEMDCINNPEDESAGTRKVSFSKVLYIEREDFLEDPPKKFFRLSPGQEVRLRSAYLVTCTRVEKDDAGEIVRVFCTHDPESRGGSAPDGRRVRGTLHWVSAHHAVSAEVRLYDRLFNVPNPGAGDGDFLDHLNPSSLEVLQGCKLEPSLARSSPGDRFQFERQGYFVVDLDSHERSLVFNRTVSLRDSWARLQSKG